MAATGANLVLVILNVLLFVVALHWDETFTIEDIVADMKAGISMVCICARAATRAVGVFRIIVREEEGEEEKDLEPRLQMCVCVFCPVQMW